MNSEDIKREEEKLLAEDTKEIEKKFPSVFAMTRNVMKQAWLSGTEALKGKGLLSSPEKARARLDICESCEFYHNHRCLKCGCFMEKKIHLEAAQCPLNKWGDLQTPSTMKEMYPLSTVVDINTFPENERAMIAEISKHAAISGNNFYHGGKCYTAKLHENESVDIFPCGQVPGKNAPSRETKNITSWYTPEEMPQFNAMVEQAKASDNKTFVFKGTSFTVRTDGDKTVVGLTKHTT